jgi:hypothetical protein
VLAILRYSVLNQMMHALRIFQAWRAGFSGAGAGQLAQLALQAQQTPTRLASLPRLGLQAYRWSACQTVPLGGLLAAGVGPLVALRMALWG